ncbi:MAG: DUF2314 domain-containing protein [Flavobacteriaceae bacterium]|jgi:uncharacterized protein YegJ (DUF2314 family)|nr:DUF2314 domain-containing protein [Flavobacteriaceae bacterium]
MSEKKIFYAQGDDPILVAAYEKAQDTFKYFWREVAWEYRRIIPGLSTACVKVAFTEEVPGSDDVLVEHMWIGNIDFDGSVIYGELLNEPIDIKSIKVGDEVGVTIEQISDWMIVSDDKTYGGFTIQAMRSVMSDEERQEHDAAWGLDFGSYDEVLVVRDQIEHPEYLIEHPMSVNMKDSLIEFLDQNPDEVKVTDEAGITFLHREVIAGNLTSTEVLLEKGADKLAKTKDGKTALDFARELNWSHIIPVLS